MKLILLFLPFFLSIHPDSYAPPSIIGDEIIRIHYNNDYDIEKLLTHFSVKYPNAYPNVRFHFDSYINFKVPGKYYHTVYATDLLDHTSSFDFVLDIYDDSFPVIKGPSSYIFTTYNYKSLEEILLDFHADDDYSKRIPLEVKADTYSSNYGIEGNYHIILEAQDLYLNKTTKRINIIVSNLLRNVYVYDDIKVVLEKDKYLSPSSMLNYLIDNLFVEYIDYVHCEYTYTIYPKYYNIIGIYPTTLEVYTRDDLSSRIIINTTIYVTTFEKKENPEKTSGLEYYFQKIFNIFKSFILKFLNRHL